MAALSDYLEGRIVKHFLQGDTQPATGDTITAGNPVYLALFTASPTEAGLTANEADYTGYARQPATWDPFDGDQTANSNPIQFDANANVDQASITITHAAIFDSGTAGGGNMLLHGELASSKTLAVDDVLAFSMGSIIFTLN